MLGEMLVKQTYHHFLFYYLFHYLPSFKDSFCSGQRRENPTKCILASIGYPQLCIRALNLLEYSTCEHTYLCKEKPLCEQQQRLFDLTCASCYGEIVGRVFLIIALQVQLAPLSFPPSLPLAVSVARSETERGGFHSSWLISLASHYCLMIRFSCATSLIY